MSKKQTARKILPMLPDDWWDRTPDELVLDAPGKMELNHVVYPNGFEVQLSIVTSPCRTVSFRAMGGTYRDGIRKVEADAIAAGFVQRRRK